MPRKSAQIRSKKRKRKTSAKKLGLNKLKRVFQLTALFFVSLTFLLAYLGYKYLNQQFASADSAYSYTLSEDVLSAFSYIVVDDLTSESPNLERVEYIILDKESKKVLKYSFHTNMAFDMPGRFGEETLTKTFLIAGLDSENVLNEGVDLINRVIFKTFAFKIDGFFVVDEALAFDMDKFITSGSYGGILDLKNILNINDLIYTNVDLKGFYSLGKFIKSLPSDRIIVRPLPVIYEEICRVVDDEFEDISLSTDLAKERLNISVLNGAGTAGLAGFGSRVVRNLGGRVIATSNSDSVYEKSYIIARETSSESVALISRVFGIGNIISMSEAYRFTEDELVRSDIVLILGLDTANNLY